MNRLRLLFPSLHADALLVSHLASIRYLCGFSGSAGLLLVGPSRSTLFTDGRYALQAHEEVSGAGVQIVWKGLLVAAADALLRLGRRQARFRVAYSLGHITLAQREVLQARTGSRIRWEGDSNAVEELRAVKDPDELARIRKAGGLISKVFREVKTLVRPGTSELTLAAEIEYAIKRHGGDGPSFETIVASGARSAWPHARPSGKLLRKNDLVVLDMGAILRGYCSDMTRTVFLGAATKRVRKLYDAVLEAQQAAKAAICPGTTAGAIDRAARDALKQHGLARYFTHSTGHGLGLEVHEMPRLGRGEATVLQAGMVLTVEPGVYVEGLGGIRIEDDVIVTPNGAVDLTHAPTDLLEL